MSSVFKYELKIVFQLNVLLKLFFFSQLYILRYKTLEKNLTIRLRGM
jgi:hypothetical protein